MNIDHIYSRTLDRSDYERMKDLGFICDESKNVEHPHGKHCSFVMLNNWQYLEFVELRDFETHAKDHQEEIEQYGHKQFNGISLRSANPLKQYMEEKKEFLAPYDPFYEHRNYFWKENSKDYLPGWNFLRFKKVIMPNTCVWFTEYEWPDPSKKPVEAPKLAHPNTANTICAIVVEDKSKFAFANELESGIEVLEAKPSDYPNKFCFLKAVVLKADDFSTFLSVSKRSPNFTFHGLPAYRFERDPYCFDIVVI